MIHTANPAEHANNAMMQANFINPVHHASVDLSGHNLANAHQASGTSSRPSRTLPPPATKTGLATEGSRPFNPQKWVTYKIRVVCFFFFDGTSLGITGECCVRHVLQPAV